MLWNRFSFLIPITVGLGVPISIFITYGLAVSNEHVPAVWPFISDTGTFSPESCIFGILLNYAAILCMFIVYYRYRQIKIWSEFVGISRWANIAAFSLGMISCFGLSIVANFQVANVKGVHMLGAFLCFIPGTIFTVFQAVFTLKTIADGKTMFFIRIGSALVSVLATIGDIVGVNLANKHFKGTDKDKFQWSEKDGGYNYHLLSTFSEWIIVFSYCFLLGTFFWDFRDLEFSPPTVIVKSLHEGRKGRRNHRSYPLPKEAL